MPRRTQRLTSHAHPGNRPELCVKLPPGLFDRLGFVEGAEVEIYSNPSGAIVIRLIQLTEDEHDITNPRHVTRCPHCMQRLATSRQLRGITNLDPRRPR